MTNNIFFSSSRCVYLAVIEDCVTHLPQIAAFADSHYNVSKEITGNRTVSKIKALQVEARLNELAVMIGGPRFTANSFNAARELLQKADDWKCSSTES